MVYEILAYYNTGFNPTNIPYNQDVITSNFTPKRFNDCFVLQNKGLATVRIDTTWHDIDGVDYLAIRSTSETSWYFVQAVRMLNEHCAELALEQDVLTTIGLNNLNIVSGYCTRRHVRSDGLFENTLDETFTPTHPLQILGVEEITPTTSKIQNDAYLVGSTVDLTGEYNTAVDYKSTSSSCVVPKVPRVPVDLDTTIHMKIPDGILPNAKTYENKLPATYLYDYSQASVREAVTNLRSLGLDSAITSCYRIPKAFISSITKRGSGETFAKHLVTDITNNITLANFGNIKMQFEYATVKNKKTLALYHSYILASMCSGERQEYKAEDLRLDGVPVEENMGRKSPFVVVWADMSPNGKPYAFPYAYRGNVHFPWLNCVSGCSWQNTPIAYRTPSGSYFAQVEQEQTRANYNWSNRMQALQVGLDVINQANDIYKNKSFSLQDATSIASKALNVADSYRQRRVDYEKSLRAFNQAYNVQAPEINFPRDDSIQNFVGNGFVFFAIGLHQDDVMLADNYFNAYGYRVFEPLTQDVFRCRQNFNYVEASDVCVKCDQPMYLRVMAEQALSGGVRIWHVAPNNALLYAENPVRGV